MSISRLSIQKFRNLQQVELTCSPHLNLICGDNAAGKTNLLEAIYFLSRTRSFKTTQIRPLINREASYFQIRSLVQNDETSSQISIGLHRDLHQLTVRINGTPIHSLAELTRQVPLLLITPDSHQLLEGGPRQRRRLLDWGLFHTQPHFLTAWRRYQAALQQRNAALRQHAPPRTVDAWDQELLLNANLLDTQRQTFCRTLETALEPLIHQTLGDTRVELIYRRGWPSYAADDEADNPSTGESASVSMNLLDVLHRHRDADYRFGHTRFGPHRADFVVHIDGQIPYLSRGQQKLLAIALILSQATLYQLHCRNRCILLIDDLPAELDTMHRDRLMRCLAQMDAQFFITALHPVIAGNWQHIKQIDIKNGTVTQTALIKTYSHGTGF